MDSIKKYVCFITWSWGDEVVFIVAIIVIKKIFECTYVAGMVISNYSYILETCIG